MEKEIIVALLAGEPETVEQLVSLLRALRAERRSKNVAQRGTLGGDALLQALSASEYTQRPPVVATSAVAWLMRHGRPIMCLHIAAAAAQKQTTTWPHTKRKSCMQISKLLFVAPNSRAAGSRGKRGSS